MADGLAKILIAGGAAWFFACLGWAVGSYMHELSFIKSEEVQARIWEWRGRFMEARNRYHRENPGAPLESLRLPEATSPEPTPTNSPEHTGGPT